MSLDIPISSRHSLTYRESAVEKPSGQTVFLWVVAAGSCVLLGYLVATSNGWAESPAKARRDDALLDKPAVAPGGTTTAKAPAGKATAGKLRLEDIPFDGAAAFEYLKQLCAIGPRYSGSPGMARQQKLLVEHFENLGGKVSMQEFRARHPLTGDAVEMANLIVEWHPEQNQRVLFCAHYDTRPYPDRDPRTRAADLSGPTTGRAAWRC